MSAARPRELLASDLDAVTRIERATFSDPWSRQSFEESLGKEHVRSLAVDDASGRLIGYGLAARVKDEGEILNIAVDQQARGQGAGRALLQALLDDLAAHGVRHVFLEVRRSNEAAIGLYRAAGFRRLGVRRGYYGRPREDALTMALELAPQTARKG